MQFKKGVQVVDAQGNKLGSIDRVVIDPRDEEVVEIIISTGGLFGEDKVLPVSMITQTGEDTMAVNATADQVKELPDFIETHYIPLDSEAAANQGYGPDSPAPLLWYPAPGQALFTYPGTYPSSAYYPYKLEFKKNTPEGTVALKEGARVIGKDGKHVGDVEEVFTEDPDERVTHLLITKGLFSHEKKLIPATWISGIHADGVKLSVNATVIDHLQEYKG